MNARDAAGILWVFAHRILLWLVVGAALLFSYNVRAADLELGAMVGSWHKSRTPSCNGIERDWNERNPGLLFRYKYFVLGRYENSWSGCNGSKYSTLIGLEDQLGSTGPVQWSFTGGLANGYPDRQTGFGPYKLWASLNAKVGPAKLYYAGKVAAFALTWEID